MKYLLGFNEAKKSRLGYFINKVKKAKEFATVAHDGVFRKGINKNDPKIPYIIHPDSVAKIVHDVKQSEFIAHLIAAAYLHDTVEDSDVTLEDINEEFGDLVMKLVEELTTDKEKLEVSGKEEYLIDKMLGMSSWALIIKLADRLHNVSDFEDIMKYGKEGKKRWARKYAEQTRNIIEEVEWYRELSNPQKKLVDMISDKLKVMK